MYVNISKSRGLLNDDGVREVVASLCAESKLQLFHPSDQKAVVTKLNSGTLEKMAKKLEKGQMHYRYVVFMSLAMSLGAFIPSASMDHLQRVYLDCNLFETAERQIRNAIERYPNDGTPYPFPSFREVYYASNHFRACLECGEQDRNKLKKCVGCKCATYCGRECQTKDWPTHKRFCSAMQD